jgi:hypothetical protein
MKENYTCPEKGILYHGKYFEDYALSIIFSKIDLLYICRRV